METGALISKLNTAAPGAFLQKSRFGRSEQQVVWIDIQRIREISEALRGSSEDPRNRFDWLENMSVAQVNDALVLTYFLRSFAAEDRFAVLRGSVSLSDSKDKPVEVPSVSEAWPMAACLEEENHDLFGIRFVKKESAADPAARVLLPREWHGFPLRKNFVFPKEVFGIQHSREVSSDA